MRKAVYSMKADDFRNRTKNFAMNILKLFSQLPKSTEVQILGKQIIRSGTSVAANFREACRARSKAEFISKIGNCEQEADETQLWLELLRDGCGVQLPFLDNLYKESDEILSILVTMSKRAKENGRS